MNRWLTIFLIVAAGHVEAVNGGNSSPETRVLCSDSWYRNIEEKVPTGDGQGHGPDPGSGEWMSVVEFKLGIRGQPDVPARDSESWCRYIDQVIHDSGTSSAASGNSGQPRKASGASFACEKVRAGSIEAMICGDEELSSLDRTLSGVYADASRKATNEHPPVLRTEQRGWIKGRNDCWKSDDKRGCVRDEYLRRITELQARYRLVPSSGPVRFMCDGNPANEVVVTFFRTDPATLIAERGDSVSLMYLQQDSSGDWYQGRNERFQDFRGEALITWGYEAAEMHCKKAP